MARRKTLRHGQRAKLTPFEDHCWIFYFRYYLDEGDTDFQADLLAWRDLQIEFPRLRRYVGCQS